MQSFQNGRNTFSKDDIEARKFHDSDRHKERISSCTSGIQFTGLFRF